MFIRKKAARGTDYYQVVQNYRLAGRVRQSVLLSLGEWPTLAAAKAAIPARLQELERAVATKREEQSHAESHRPWPRHTRSGQANWKLIHQRAGQEIRRTRREINRLANLLEDINELEQTVTR